MAFFKSNNTKETKPVEQVQLNVSATQRSMLIQRDLTDKKRELEEMDKTMKSLQEKIERTRVLIASYQKNIIDSQKDYDRISSKHRILEDDVHTLEKELTLYNKGTHKDLLNTQDLENLNFLQAVDTIKKFDEKEKEYLEEIEILKSEIDKLKKFNKVDSKPEPPKFEVKIEEPKKENLLSKLFNKKNTEEKQAAASEGKKDDVNIVKKIVNNVVIQKDTKIEKNPVSTPIKKEKIKTTTKKSSKKLLNNKDKNKVSKKGDKQKK